MCAASPEDFKKYMKKEYGEELFTEGYAIIQSKYNDYFFEDDSEELFAKTINHLKFENDDQMN